MWIAVALLATVSVPVVAQSYDLRINVTPDLKHETAVSAELADLLLSGTSMGVTGTFKSTLELTVLKVDEDAGTFRLQVLVKDPAVTFNETEQQPPTVAPLIFTVDRRGHVEKLEGVSGFDAMDISSAGGIPVVLLAGVSCLARLPEKPVAVGDEWEIEDQQPTPFGVIAQAKIKMKLAAVEGGKARLEGTVEATCPEFKAPNPMQPGMDMIVKEAVLRFTDLVQVVDLKTGLVDEASGRLEFAINADMQGMELPAQAFVDFVSCADRQEADKRLAELREKLGEPGAEEVGAQAGGEQAKAEENKAEQAGGEVVKVGDDDFEAKVLKADKPVLVDFSATWCGPCQRQEPIIEKIARKYAGKAVVASLDIDKAPKTADKYSIEAVPTLIIFKDGQEVWRAVGLRTEEEISAALDKALGGAGDKET